MSPKSYYTIFGDRMTDEEVSSLESRMKRAQEHFSSLSDVEKAKLTDDTDVKLMLRGIIE